MHYIIYQITNTINGKIYIGKHQTDNINDGYFGSGIALQRAINEHGKNAFLKEILHVFSTADEMDAKEKELVTEEFVARKDTYNLGVGGKGGPQFKGRRHSEETKQLLRELRTQYPPITAEARLKISEANRRRIISDDTKRKISKRAKERYADPNYLNGTHVSAKKRISETMKNLYASGEHKVTVYDRTDITRSKTSATMVAKYRERYKNLVWVKNNTTGDCLRIDQGQLDEYIANGYVRGRIFAGIV